MRATIALSRALIRLSSRNTNKHPTPLSTISCYDSHRPILSIRTMTSSPTYSAEYLSDKLKKELEAEHVDIVDLSNCGCGMKFDAVLVSPKFENKPILQRQRMVNQILAEEMKHIHAFTMRTLTPSNWAQAKEKESGKS